MKTIAFYSYKGGAGRTMLLANAAVLLARAGKKVAVWDLDLEAPGLHYRFDVKPEDLSPHNSVEAMVTIFKGKALELNFQPLKLPDTGEGELYLIPAGPAPTRPYWDKLKEFVKLGQPDESSLTLLEVANELKWTIITAIPDLDYLFIDARTGITSLGGIASHFLADEVVMISTPTQESLEGTKAMKDSIESVFKGEKAKPIHCVLSRVPSAGTDLPFSLDPREYIGDNFYSLEYDGLASRYDVSLDQVTLAEHWSHGRIQGTGYLQEVRTWVGRIMIEEISDSGTLSQPDLISQRLRIATSRGVGTWPRRNILARSIRLNGRTFRCYSLNFADQKSRIHYPLLLCVLDEAGVLRRRDLKTILRSEKTLVAVATLAFLKKEIVLRHVELCPKHSSPPGLALIDLTISSEDPAHLSSSEALVDLRPLSS